MNKSIAVVQCSVDVVVVFDPHSLEIGPLNCEENTHTHTHTHTHTPLNVVAIADDKVLPINRFVRLVSVGSTLHPGRCRNRSSSDDVDQSRAVPPGSLVRVSQFLALVTDRSPKEESRHHCLADF